MTIGTSPSTTRSTALSSSWPVARVTGLPTFCLSLSQSVQGGLGASFCAASKHGSPHTPQKRGMPEPASATMTLPSADTVPVPPCFHSPVPPIGLPS